MDSGQVEECEIYGNALGGVRILQASDPLIRNCRINRNSYHGIHVSERAEGAVVHSDETGSKVALLSLNGWLSARGNVAVFGKSFLKVFQRRSSASRSAVICASSSAH